MENEYIGALKALLVSTRARYKAAKKLNEIYVGHDYIQAEEYMLKCQVTALEGELSKHRYRKQEVAQ